MPLPYYITSGEEAREAGDSWVTILDFATINSITLINEGETPGWYRLLDNGGSQGAPARIVCGAGGVGQCRAAFNISCPNFSGKLQIRSVGAGQRITGIFAIGQL